MKKIYTVIIASLFMLSFSNLISQSVLLYQDFEFFPSPYHSTIDSVAISPGNTTDTTWYTFDLDLIPDASGGNRPDAWFAIRPFSDADYTATGYIDNNGNADLNTVMGANSWNNLGEGTAGKEDNWIITPSVTLGANDTLFWKAAPRQTPRYLDGYEVLLSTTTNDVSAFTTVLFTAAEMTALGTDSTFATFQFAPSNAFIHGIDGTYVEYANDSIRLIGQLRPFFKSLSAYAGQKVFIAFHHNSHDDNLISIDDVIIGNKVNQVLNSTAELKNDGSFKLFPNPASDNVDLQYVLKASSAVSITVYDITGKVVYTENKGTQSTGLNSATINTSLFSKGYYTVAVQSASSRTVGKLIVK